MLKLKKIIIILAAVVLMFAFSHGYIEKNYIYPLKYSEYVEKAAAEYDVDKYLVYSIIKAESSFNEYARSHADAKGLMQVTDETAKWAAEKMNMHEDFNIYNPEININIGTWYISKLLTDNGGDLVLALASYNAGGGNVKKWLENSGKDELDIDKIEFEETKTYVAKTLKYYEKYKNLYD